MDTFQEKLRERMTEQELNELLQGVRGADAEAAQAARRYVESLAAPPGSLGKLTDAAIQLAGITGRVNNTVKRRRIIVLCADNGVVEEGVSSTPPIVTLSQALNMTRHLTGMSAMAAHFGCDVDVVDVGIATPYEIPRNTGAESAAEGHADSDNISISAETKSGQRAESVGRAGSGIVLRRIRRGTGNIAKEPAMTREEAIAAIGVGIERARKAHQDGIQVIGVGEMGIGNTTTSSAVLAALTGLAVETVTGRGGGLTDAAFAKKKRVIADALKLHGLDTQRSARQNAFRREGTDGTAEADGVPDVIDILAKVGGLDLAAMCGVFLGAAIFRIPVVIDGFISIVAALCAKRICPFSRDFMFPSHASEEIGYMRAARELKLDPWLQLNMRLGEGSGCPLAFQVLEAACVLMNDMATFEEAQIDDGYLAEIRAMR